MACQTKKQRLLRFFEVGGEWVSQHGAWYLGILEFQFGFEKPRVNFVIGNLTCCIVTVDYMYMAIPSKYVC